jgi:hypothetical protein
MENIKASVYKTLSIFTKCERDNMPANGITWEMLIATKFANANGITYEKGL